MAPTNLRYTKVYLPLKHYCSIFVLFSEQHSWKTPIKRAFQYAKDMKRLVLAAALLLTVAGLRVPVQRFADPIADCPPACNNTDNVIVQVQ